jgi:hypothetical protein
MHLIFTNVKIIVNLMLEKRKGNIPPFMRDAGAGRWNQTTKQRAGSPVSSK